MEKAFQDWINWGKKYPYDVFALNKTLIKLGLMETAFFFEREGVRILRNS